MPTRMRLKEMRWVKASELAPNPENWRTHPAMQREALEGLLDEVGFADVLLAYERDGVMTLVDGHLRADILGDELVPVGILDVDQAEARKILLTLDPLAALAQTNAETLDILLNQVTFNTPAITDLLNQLAEMTMPDTWDTDMAAVNSITPSESPILDKVLVQCPALITVEVREAIQSALEPFPDAQLL